MQPITKFKDQRHASGHLLSMTKLEAPSWFTYRVREVAKPTSKVPSMKILRCQKAKKRKCKMLSLLEMAHSVKVAPKARESFAQGV